MERDVERLGQLRRRCNRQRRRRKVDARVSALFYPVCYFVCYFVWFGGFVWSPREGHNGRFSARKTRFSFRLDEFDFLGALIRRTRFSSRLRAAVSTAVWGQLFAIILQKKVARHRRSLFDIVSVIVWRSRPAVNNIFLSFYSEQQEFPQIISEMAKGT